MKFRKFILGFNVTVLAAMAIPSTMYSAEKPPAEVLQQLAQKANAERRNNLCGMLSAQINTTDSIKVLDVQTKKGADGTEKFFVKAEVSGECEAMIIMHGNVKGPYHDVIEFAVKYEELTQQEKKELIRAGVPAEELKPEWTLTSRKSGHFRVGTVESMAPPLHDLVQKTKARPPGAISFGGAVHGSRAGDWKGTAVRTADEFKYPIEIKIDSDRFELGQKVGRENFPTAKCSGDLILKEQQEDGTLVVKTKIDKGVPDYCPDGGTALIQLSGHNLVWNFYSPGKEIMPKKLKKLGLSAKAKVSTSDKPDATAVLERE